MLKLVLWLIRRDIRLRAHTAPQPRRQHLGIMKSLLCVTIVLVSRFKMKCIAFSCVEMQTLCDVCALRRNLACLFS